MKFSAYFFTLLRLKIKKNKAILRMIMSKFKIYSFVFKKISVLKDCNSNGLKNLSETKLTIKAIKFFFINLKTLKNLAEFSNIC